MVDAGLLKYFNTLIEKMCMQRGYEYTNENDKITIYKGNNKVKYEIKSDLFINKDHVEQSFMKLQENLKRRLEKNESN